MPGLSFISKVLKQLLCLAQQMVEAITKAMVLALNQLIVYLAAVIDEVMDLMPTMPAFPDVPTEFTTAVGWVAWLFPVNTVFDIVAFLIAAWLVWQGVMIALRWAKASGE